MTKPSSLQRSVIAVAQHDVPRVPDQATVPPESLCGFFSHLGGLFCCFINTSDHAEACSCFTGVPFPKNFMSVAKTILKRLFRVYAHIYHQHFDSVMRLQEEAHLNTSFKHFIFFVQVRCGTAAQLPLPGLFVPVCF